MQYNKESLEALKRDDIRKIAKEKGVVNVGKYTKGELIGFILVAVAAEKRDKTLPTSVNPPEETKKASTVFYIKNELPPERKTQKRAGKDISEYIEQIEAGDVVVYRHKGVLDSGRVRRVNHDEDIRRATVTTFSGHLLTISLDEIVFCRFNFDENGNKVFAKLMPSYIFNELKGKKNNGDSAESNSSNDRKVKA